jgi:hypothetical protein
MKSALAGTAIHPLEAVACAITPVRLFAKKVTHQNSLTTSSIFKL